jgi:hypothetical protein
MRQVTVLNFVYFIECIYSAYLLKTVNSISELTILDFNKCCIIFVTDYTVHISLYCGFGILVSGCILLLKSKDALYLISVSFEK